VAAAFAGWALFVAAASRAIEALPLDWFTGLAGFALLVHVALFHLDGEVRAFVEAGRHPARWIAAIGGAAVVAGPNPISMLVLLPLGAILGFALVERAIRSRAAKSPAAPRAAT
jgi:hypothetical protein